MAAAVKLQEVRGPKVGDAASLWNFAPAPGWTHDEVAIFKLCLQKHGVGCWQSIQRTGLLPGKLVQQMVGQAQRLLGQQSLAAFTGLQLDIDRIRQDNASRTDVQRKAGLIIYTGPTATTEMKEGWRRDMQEKYGLSTEMLCQVSARLEEHAAMQLDTVGGEGLQGAAARTALLDMMGCDTSQIPPAVAAQLLSRLRTKLGVLVDRLRARLGLTAADKRAWEEAAGEGSTDIGPDGIGTEAGDAADSLCAVQQRLARPPRPRQRGGARTVKQPGPGRASSLLGSKQGELQGHADGSNSTTSRKRQRTGAAVGAGHTSLQTSMKEECGSQDNEMQVERQDVVCPAAEPARRSKRATAKAAMDAAIEADLASLQSMGFSRGKAETALLETGGCVEAALDWLLTTAA